MVETSSQILNYRMQYDKNQGMFLNSYKKYDGEKLELVMSVHVDDIFMVGRPETLENFKEIIKLKFNIQASGKVKKFIGVYYEWVNDAKVP